MVEAASRAAACISIIGGFARLPRFMRAIYTPCEPAHALKWRGQQSHPPGRWLRSSFMLTHMSDAIRHHGSCHCGRVRYQVTLDLGKPVISCNCSMCGRSGTLLAFVPASGFKLLAGEDALGDYQFNKHVIHHLFCTTCGIKAFARGQMPDGTPTVAVNVRCLENVDLDGLTVQKFDGKSH